jgi:hypothetical protein
VAEDDDEDIQITVVVDDADADMMANVWNNLVRKDRGQAAEDLQITSKELRRRSTVKKSVIEGDES